MLEVIRNDNYTQMMEATNHKGGDPCIICGRACPDPKHRVRFFWGSHVVTHEEAAEIIEEDGDDRGDLNYYPIGSDCLRKHPEYKPYVEDAAKAIQEAWETKVYQTIRTQLCIEWEEKERLKREAVKKAKRLLKQNKKG